MKPVKHLAIGLLYFNKGLPQFERALYAALETLRQSGLVSQVSFIERHGMAVDMARNSIVAEALQQDADAVVWIDTDLIFPATALVDLVEMANAGHYVAAGLYRRAIGEHNVITKIKPTDDWATLEDLQAAKDGGVVPVYITAGGFSIVRVEVYKDMAVRLGMPWFCNWDWHKGDQCGEDTFFMRRLHKLGLMPVVDPDLHAVHWSHHGPVPVVPDQPEMAYCQ